jgi:hypothetical protein
MSVGHGHGHVYVYGLEGERLAARVRGMSRRLLLYCGLWVGLWSAGVRAQEPASPEAKQEPSPAPAVQTPAPAAPAAPVAPARRWNAPPDAEQVADQERAPTHEVIEPPPGLFVRLALGVGVGFLTAGAEASAIQLLASTQLDVGYGFTPEFAVLLRVGTWLDYNPFALHFLGAGVRFGFQPEGMFVNALLGVSIADGEFGFQGSSDEDIQGLALHLDVGQRFPIVETLDFEIGAHFELGTPLFASDLEFTSIGFGPFIALRWGA